MWVKAQQYGVETACAASHPKTNNPPFSAESEGLLVGANVTTAQDRI